MFTRQISIRATFLMLALLWADPVTAASPAVRKGGPPNILFAIADDWGYGHASAYGAKWVNTPAFDRVAREGLLFHNAYTPNAKCAPSRACILTGRNSWQLKEAANHICYFPAEFKTWAEALRDNGWFTGMTMKGWGPGVANDVDGKPRQMAGQPFNKRTTTPPAKNISNNDYAGNFEDFLAAAPEGKPWCFWYGAIEPHRAYEHGVGVAKGGKKLSDIDRVPAYWPDNETVRNDILDYGYEVEHFDRHLGRMLELLEKRGVLDNTLVIVTSDHGMPFPRCKGNAYEFSNHIPLAIRWPAGMRKSGRVVEDYVSFIDLAPTVIEVAGLKWPQTGMAPATGRSLTEIFNSTKSGRIVAARDHVLIGMERHDVGRPNDWGYPIRAIIKDRQLYIRNYEPDRWPACNPETGYLNCDAGATKTFILNAHRESPGDQPWALCFGKRPGEELYDLKSDPDCMKNLAAMPAHDRLKSQLRTQMEKDLRAQADPRMFGQGHIFDEYVYSNEGTRNFYERFMKGEKLNANWVLPSDFEKAPLD